MTKKLTQLGRPVKQPSSPDKAVLEAVANPHPDTDYLVRFTAPEFTSLCPITGQPDFAHYVIDYVPGAKIVESKSLKLFLTSFRNASGFHEDCSLHHRQAHRQGHQAQIRPWRAFGIRAAAFPSTFSGRAASCLPMSGCLIPVCKAIAGEADLGRGLPELMGKASHRDIDRSLCGAPAKRRHSAFVQIPVPGRQRPKAACLNTTRCPQTSPG